MCPSLSGASVVQDVPGRACCACAESRRVPGTHAARVAHVPHLRAARGVLTGMFAAMPRSALLPLNLPALLVPSAGASASILSRNVEEAPANLISLTYNDGSNQVNDVAFAHEGSEIVARESSAELRQENCTGGAVESRCDATGVESFGIDLGGAGDMIDLGGLGALPFKTTVQLGPGDDHATVGAATKVEVDGDTGDDVLTGGPNADDLTGGEGNDRIAGGDGDDQLATGGGRDTVDGGAGDDAIYGSGEGVDHISCGPGNDKVFAEPRDVIAPDCEKGRTVLVPPAKQFTAKVRADGRVLIPLGSMPEGARLVASLGPAPPQGQGSRVPIGSARKAGKAGTQSVRVHLTKSGRKAVSTRPRIRVTAVVRVTTSAGKTSITDVTGHLELSKAVRKQFQREAHPKKK